MNKIKQVSLSLLGIVASLSAMADEGMPGHYDNFTHSVSYDTGYSSAPKTNRAVADFGLEVHQLHGFLFDQAGELDFISDSAWGRGGLYFGDFLFIAPIVSQTFSTVFHEHGHYTRAQSQGFEPKFKDRPNNVFSFFGQKLVSGPFQGEAVEFRNPNGLTADQAILIGAAGVNNEMRFAGDLADETYFSQGHIADFTAYGIGKLSSALYSREESWGNDFSTIRSGYDNKGYGISRRQMNNANYASFFLSSSTYAYAFGAYNYITEGGSTAVHAFEYEGIRLPDVENYLTTKGISYKIKSGYRVDDTLVIPVAFEFIAKGKSQNELTVGFRKTLSSVFIDKSLTYGADAILGKELSGKAFGTMRFHNNMQATLGIEHHRAKTLNGERNINTRKANKTYATEVWAKLSFLY